MPKILIAEDEPHTLRVMSLWLTRHGHHILEAVNGEAALARLDTEAVDMIISDMNMPRIDGLGLVKAVCEERGLDVPFMLLTARCDRNKLLKALQPYHVHLYLKPFVPSRLVADIDRMLAAVGVSGENQT